VDKRNVPRRLVGTVAIRLRTQVILPKADRVSIEFVSFGDQTFDAIEKGWFNLMLNTDDGYLPPRFASEMIFHDTFSCVAAKESVPPQDIASA
jgi:hypothetical protein